jgi:hypothetical protein
LTVNIFPCIFVNSCIILSSRTILFAKLCDLNMPLMYFMANNLPLSLHLALKTLP